ncbi:MAG TPA: DUF3108 domain-containing protein [Geobacter sp.]|nr:DUF3108 domain-containing protein [Geobacter sp.]
MKRLAVVIQSILFVALLFSPALAVIAPEKLVYEVKWGGIKAGSAILEATAEGNEIRIVNTIRSTGLVSAFFSIDDKTESVISREGKPRIFKENINEGRFKARKEVSFNFTDLFADGKDLLKKIEKRDAISARTYDNLSSIYFIRSTKLVPGQSIYFDIYSFKHLWNTEVRVVKREEVTTPLGRFKTIMVTSQLKYDGVPARVGNATFWFTDDSRRIPVRITTQLKVGEITLTLVGRS